MSEIKTFKKGEIIFEEGAYETTMYEITEGSVEIIASYGTAVEKSLVTLGAGDIFGEMGLLDYMMRSATARACTDTKVLEITDEEFDDFIKDDPQKLMKILKSVSLRTTELSKEYVEACDDIKAFYKAEQPEEQPGLFERIMRLVKFASKNSEYKA